MDNEYSTHPSNDSQQFTPTPQEHSHKKSRKKLIAIALAIAIVAAVVAVLLALLNALDKPGGKRQSVTSTQAPSTTFVGDAFIDDRYATGAKTLVVEGGDVEVLGLNSDATRLAIVEESRQGATLVVYDTGSQSRVASTPVESCTSWREDEVVCSSDEGSIRAYSMKDATPVSDTVLYRHPFATDRAYFSKVGKLDYMGEVNGAHLLTLEPSNTFLGEESMTEEERAIAGPMIVGTRTVSKQFVVAIDGAGSTKWSYELGNASDCGLVSNGERALCLSIQDSGRADVQVLDSANGQSILQYNTNRGIVVASDGWVEYENAYLDTEMDADSLLSDTANGSKIYIFGLDGKMKREAQMPIGAVPGEGFIPKSAWERGKRVLYTTEQIASAQAAEPKVLSASGGIVAVSGINDKGQYTLTPTSDDTLAGTGMSLFSSADGHLVVALDSEDTSSEDGSPRAYLLDLRTGKKIQSLDKGTSVLMQVSKGLLVDLQNESSSDTLERRNIIYLPVK